MNQGISVNPSEALSSHTTSRTVSPETTPIKSEKYPDVMGAAPLEVKNSFELDKAENSKEKARSKLYHSIYIILTDLS